MIKIQGHACRRRLRRQKSQEYFVIKLCTVNHKRSLRSAVSSPETLSLYTSVLIARFTVYVALITVDNDGVLVHGSVQLKTTMHGGVNTSVCRVYLRRQPLTTVLSTDWAGARIILVSCARRHEGKVWRL